MSDGAIALPGHVYVPGVSPRHDEDAFKALRDTAQGLASADELAASAAFRAGLIFLNRGYYWEAHEVLEPVWHAARPQSHERHLIQALIQLANAALKKQMGRPRAVLRLCAMVDTHLAEAERSGRSRIMGVDLLDLRRMCADIRPQIYVL